MGINPQTIERDESLIYATLHYLQTGKMGASDLENLIKAQTGMSSEQKKKLVTFFVPAISVNQLESFGLIGADQREKWIFDILNEILRNE